MALLDTAGRAIRPGFNPTNVKAAGGAPSDSIGHIAFAGWLIIAIFFGGIGTWAVMAPLNGAVVGNAVIKIDGNRKINQLMSQITGAEAQVKSYTDQITSVRAEARDIAPLVERGLIARPRIMQLDRTAFGLEGQIADANANIAKARQAIAEQRQQIAQLDNDRMADVTRDLRDTQAKMLEVIPKAMNAKAALGRMEIRSPYAGRVG